MKETRAPLFYDLVKTRSFIKKRNCQKLILANGCFDVLHVGHVRYLRAAKELGDFLLVAINDDESAKRFKGKGRPILNEGARASIITALEMVDAVLMFSFPDVSPILEALRPYCHAKGTDYTVQTVPEIGVSRKLGVKCAIVGDPKNHATTDLIKKIKK